LAGRRVAAAADIDSKRGDGPAVDLACCLQAVAALELDQGVACSRTKAAIRFNGKALAHKHNLNLTDFVCRQISYATRDGPALAGTSVGRPDRYHSHDVPAAVADHNLVPCDEIRMAAPLRMNVNQDRRDFDDAYPSRDDSADPYGEVHAVDPWHIASSAEYSFTDAGLLLSRHSNASATFLTLTLLLPILLLVTLLALLLTVLLLVALFTLLLPILLLVATLLTLLLPILLVTLFTLLLPILLVTLFTLLLPILLLVTLFTLLLPILVSLGIAIFTGSLSSRVITLRPILLGTALSLLGLVALGLLTLALPSRLRAISVTALPLGPLLPLCTRLLTLFLLGRARAALTLRGAWSVATLGTAFLARRILRRSNHKAP
jgi:hypothetical protein